MAGFNRVTEDPLGNYTTTDLTPSHTIDANLRGTTGVPRSRAAQAPSSPTLAPMRHPRLRHTVLARARSNPAPAPARSPMLGEPGQSPLSREGPIGRDRGMEDRPTIFDGHAYCFPPLDGAGGFSDGDTLRPPGPPCLSWPSSSPHPLGRRGLSPHPHSPNRGNPQLDQSIGRCYTPTHPRRRLRHQRIRSQFQCLLNELARLWGT